MDERIDMRYHPHMQYHQINEKEKKKTMSKFQFVIMLKIGVPLGLTILIVGLMNNLIVFYSFGHIMKISQHIFQDNEQFALNSLNYQQSRTVSNYVQSIVTALHQLNKINTEQISSIIGTQTDDFDHCYPKQYKEYLKTTLNCVCDISNNCSYSQNDFDDIKDCTNTSTIPDLKWYETDIKSQTARTPDQYVYFAASQPQSNFYDDQQYNKIRVARLIYKSMKNYIDFIKITHQSGVEMFYSEQDVSSKYKCNYSAKDDTIFKKTSTYQKLYKKNLVEHLFIDETEISQDKKIKSQFCLFLPKMVYCQSGVDIPCGQICIQSSNQIQLIQVTENLSFLIVQKALFTYLKLINFDWRYMHNQLILQKILGKSIIIDSHEYFLISAQENGNQQVINKQIKNSEGKIISFEWLYQALFNQDISQTLSYYVKEFHSIFGKNYFPYTNKKSKEEQEFQNQGFGQYYLQQTDKSFSYSYVKVDQDYEDHSNHKFLYTLMSQFDTHDSLKKFQNVFDKEDELNQNWIWVGIVTFASFILCYLFLKSFASSLANPIIELTSKVKQIKEGNLDINLLVDFKCKIQIKFKQDHIIQLKLEYKIYIKQYNLLKKSYFSEIQISSGFKTFLKKYYKINDKGRDFIQTINSFKEVNELYEELEEVNLQIKYSTDNFYNNKSDAENLVNLTNAVCVYSKLKNQKILGIILNNLGNVHARNQRFQEAIACFRKAVKIAEKELRKLVRFDYPEVFYKAKRVSGWKDFQYYREPVSPLGWLDEEEKIFKINDKRQVRVNTKLKKKLEEVFCNRLFSLATVLILFGELETKDKIKIVYFEEAIDHLNLVECIDKCLDHARSRSIKIHFKLSFAYINRAKLTSKVTDWCDCIDSLQKAQSKFYVYESVHNLFRVEILKRKQQKEQLLHEENMSIRKSYAQSTSNFLSQFYLTNKVSITTEDSISKFQSRRNNPMNIEMFQYQSRNNYSPSRKMTREIPEIIAQYQRPLSEEETELEVIIDDPPEILKSELQMVKGQVHYEFGVYDKSLQYCTQAIEEGKYFNPDIRRECLKIQLKQEKLEKEARDSQELNLFYSKILTDLQKAQKTVKQMLQEAEVKGKKDLIFLFDISETMNNKKIKAVQAFMNIRETYIKMHDRMAFIKFNHNIDIVFELQTRGKNDKFIDKFLTDAQRMQCFGDKALYNAIYDGIKLFQIQIYSYLNRKAEPTPNSRWLVTITDDCDNYSRIDEEELKPLFFQNNVKLIIIGLNLKNSAKDVYSKLCKSTGGTFIESPNSSDLNVAFQSITNLQFATDQQSNYVDEKFD